MWQGPVAGTLETAGDDPADPQRFAQGGGVTAIRLLRRGTVDAFRAYDLEELQFRVGGEGLGDAGASQNHRS